MNKKAGLQEKNRRPHTLIRATKPWVQCKLKQEVEKLQQERKRKLASRLQMIWGTAGERIQGYKANRRALLGCR